MSHRSGYLALSYPIQFPLRKPMSVNPHDCVWGGTFFGVKAGCLWEGCLGWGALLHPSSCRCVRRSNQTRSEGSPSPLAWVCLNWTRLYRFSDLQKRFVNKHWASQVKKISYIRFDGKLAMLRLWPYDSLAHITLLWISLYDAGPLCFHVNFHARSGVAPT